MSKENSKNLIERPPVVVIMGHIDHGKSTLLDYIRNSKIVEKEAGGITQHITAYEVELDKGESKKKITFLDTPGHEAFCTVRDRGASIADVAILIVSAEDGVMPQTLEVLKSIKESEMPFIVAINKIDSPKANIERTKQSLSENEVYLEGYGGHVSFVPISAKTGEGVDELLDLILLTAEVEEFSGDTSKLAEGFIVEAHKDAASGISGILIIKDGILNKGNFIASKDAIAPVRNIRDHNGKAIDKAQFSAPVLISGWNTQPPVGAFFKTFDKKKEAEKFCKDYEASLSKDSNNNVASTAEVVIPIIIKSDVIGSAEAVAGEIKKIETDKVEFKVIEMSTGNITEKDMKLAAGNESTIVAGFNVGADTQANALQERHNVTTKTFNIIYELTDWLRDIVTERTPKEEVDEVGGKAKILKVFSNTKNIYVVGGRVTEGTLRLKNQVKILRRDEEIGRGIIKELQSQKVKVDSVNEDNEFGTALETKTEIVEGDYIEAFKTVIK